MTIEIYFFDRRDPYYDCVTMELPNTVATKRLCDILRKERDDIELTEKEWDSKFDLANNILKPVFKKFDEDDIEFVIVPKYATAYNDAIIFEQ